jgi:formylmethanofuran dehydrogenase subunit E
MWHQTLSTRRLIGVSTGVTMPQASRVIRIVRCNGCRRLKDEVTYMIAGTNVYMCDHCVAQGARQLTAPRRVLTPRRPAADAVRCRFCRQLRSKDEATSVGSATVCVDCLGVMEGVLAEAERASRPAT